MRRLHGILVSFALLLTGGAQAAADGYADVTFEKVLDNGLKVIVREDHRAPVVAAMVWYKVGSSYEHSGITGISHVLEHMMFQGTEKHPAGEFSRIISAQGGEQNAFTSRDYTAYYQQLEASRLAISFELEADRMRNLRLLEKEFSKERNVVMEERRLRTEDKPMALTYERFMATGFMASPYQHPVIGWMNDLASLTLADLERWYRQWYAPNNAVVVVVGDVEADAVFALARKHFGPLQPSTIDPPKPRLEPEHHGARQVTVKRPARLPLLLMGYRTPVLRGAEEAWKAYALEMLAGVLDYGDSARIPRELVRGRAIAASAGAGYTLYGLHDGMLMFEAVPAEGHDVAELEQAFREQIGRLQEERVSDGELQRIKAQVTAAKVFERDSVFYQANQIGKLEALGLGWQVGEEYEARIRAVTAEQIRQVAREFLVDERLTIAHLEPQPLDEVRQPQARPGAMQHVRP